TTIVLTGTLTDINAALDGLIFTPDNFFAGVATLTLDVSDQSNTGSGGALTDSVAIDIVVGPVNDPPIVTAREVESLDEDTTLTFSVAGDNAITFSDVDANGQTLELTLTATHGIITLANDEHVTGGEDGSSTVTLTGTLAQLNAAV